MTIAINDAGDVMAYTGGAWKPAVRAVNDKTGEMMALDGDAWKSIPTPKTPSEAPDTSAAMTDFPTYAAPASPEPAPGNAAIERIGGAAAKAFNETPEVLTPVARDALNKYGGTGLFGVGEFANQVAHGATNVIGAARGGMAALSQAAMEVFGEKGGRDALAFLSSLPMAQGERMSLNPVAASEAAPRLPGTGYMISGGLESKPVAAIADIGKATDVDGAIAAAGQAVEAPSARPMAEWMQPVSKTTPEPAPLLRAEELSSPAAVAPPEPMGAPQSMSDYLAQNSISSPEPTPTTQTVSASIRDGDVVNTSKAAKQIAQAHYKIMDQAGGELLPSEVTNSTLDYARKLAEEDPMVTDARGTAHPIAKMADSLEKYRDKPMSLQAQTGLDRLWGDMINKEYDNRGHLSSEGQEMLDLQSHLRGLVQDEIDNPEGAGLPGFEAKIAANKAWSAAMKLDDLERMKERAERTLNPDQSIKTQINAYLSNKTRSRGLTAAERSAYEAAARTGVLDGALKIVGSRLTAIGGLGMMAHGVFTLNPATMALGAAELAGSALARRGLVGIGVNRLGNVANVIGNNVPAPPNTP